MNELRSLGIVDAPSKYNEDDSLGTNSYAKALVDFITYSNTPITIGVQGEWGSGKTSLLNTIHGDLAERGNYKQIWINSWEHSLLASPEEALISITSEIISEILGADLPAERGDKVKNIAKSLFSGAAKVGATVALGSAAGEMVDDFMKNTNEASIKNLRLELQSITDEIRDRETNKYECVVVYVDDLDRIEPKNAVVLLELLKNIFNVTGCIFVLAIDYQVVVKGLEHKFGPRTESNEWEFRAFFDKIIQLPFMMPLGEYDIGTYVNDLLKRINYISKGGLDPEAIQILIENSIGGNPRALKRLVNSLSLIEIFSKNKIAEKNSKDTNILDQDSEQRKLLLFSLICLQIAYPNIYTMLMQRPNFELWDDVLAFSLTQGKEKEDKNFEENYKAVIETEDFDEEWERVLYRVCFISPRYRSRAVNISKFLSFIKDEILKDSEDIGPVIAEILSQTAVTSVTSTDEAPPKGEVKTEKQQTMFDFWSVFLEKINHKGVTEFKKARASKYSDMQASSSISGCRYLAMATKREVRVGVALVASKEINKFIFDELAKEKGDIEKQFGAELNWYRKSENKTSEINFPFEAESGNRDEWDNITTQLSDLMGAMILSVSQRLDNIAKSEEFKMISKKN